MNRPDYRSGAIAVLMAGIIGGIVGTAWGLAPPWVAFAAGAVPTLLLIAIAYTFLDDPGRALNAFRCHVADEEPEEWGPPSDAMIELRDRAIDAYRAGETEEFTEMDK